MNGPNILEGLRGELAAAIGPRPFPMPTPLGGSPWIAMSVLQKAIRRGRETLALEAAANLLISSPERLWRRIGSVAVEDVGVGDIDATVAATAALAGKRFRSTLGGEWQVASHVIRQLCKASKCRSADDLLMTAELHPAFEGARHSLADHSTADLLSIASSDRVMQVRALALWFALGTDRRPSPHLTYRRGNPEEVFEALLEMGSPLTVVQIAQESFRRVREVLGPFVALLCTPEVPTGPVTYDDVREEETLSGGIPSWALDVYSREGRRAIVTFLNTNAESARFSREHFDDAERLTAFGNALFRVEGGLVDRRLEWAGGTTLRGQMDVECFPGIRDGGQFLSIVRSDLALLNEVRRAVL